MVHIKAPPPVTIIPVWIIPWYNRSMVPFHHWLHSVTDSIPSNLKFTVRRHDSIIPRHDPFLDIIPPASNYFQSAIQKQAIKKSAGSIRWTGNIRSFQQSPQAVFCHRALHQSRQSKSRQAIRILQQGSTIPTVKGPMTVYRHVCETWLWERLHTWLLSGDVVCCLGNLTGTPTVVWKTWPWERFGCGNGSDVGTVRMWERFGCGNGSDVNLVNFWHGELLSGESLSGERLNYEMAEWSNAADS